MSRILSETHLRPLRQALVIDTPEGAVVVTRLPVGGWMFRSDAHPRFRGGVPVGDRKRAEQYLAWLGAARRLP